LVTSISWTTKPRLLDAFCCQGGATRGYQNAGFKVVGVDIAPQPRYIGDSFFQRDAVEFIRTHGKRFDAIHASPPCQAFTNAQKIMGNEHPDLIEPVRELLLELGKPFVIENVPGSPLNDPIELCGAMFGLQTYRHRLFESNIDLVAPEHPAHVARTTKMGRKPVEGEFMHVVGNFSGVAKAKEAMGGMDWMNRDDLRESIPPAYTEWIGRQLMESLGEVAA
jgi:DNA (cytosine-5)-methyltransferase 1